MSSFKYFPALFILIVAGTVYGFPNGAPIEACESMYPNHGAKIQTGPAPYTIIISKSNCKINETIKITIKANRGVRMKGFLVMCRTKIGAIVGTVSGCRRCKEISAGNGVKNAITHTDSSKKSWVSFYWTALMEVCEEVICYATIVKNYNEYWVRVPSTPICMMNP